MSTIRELIQSHLTDEPQTRLALAELVGVAAGQVSSELTGLQGQGLAVRSAGGWIAGNGSSKAPRVHTAPDAAAEPPDAERKKTARRKKTLAAAEQRHHKAKGPYKPRRKRKAMAAPVAPPKAATKANGHERQCEFAIAESGDVLFKIVRGPRAGELGSINHVDAMALFRLMESCDFIRENA